MRFKFYLIIIFASLTSAIIAQKGSIRGVVFDGKTGEYLPGVTIFLEGTTTGTITDLDGKFNLNTDAGTYTLRASFISYETLNLLDLVAISGEVLYLGELKLSEASLSLNEVTITASAIRNTEAAIISMKRKSPNVIDGISATSISRIGDSDAAGAMKRVPGVSVSQGKYVYVRGLGDRYTKSLLNGVDIPGLDPDRNTLQMDIFPTSVVDNIIVHKTFSPELPADFTGGAVDIELKDFPNKKEASVNLKLGYNPQSHFNSEYLDYEGGKTDFLGFDDGTRAIPATENIPQYAQAVGDPDGETGTRYREILNTFNPNMAAFQKNSLADIGFGFSFGNQKPKEKRTLGYNFAFSYKNTTKYYGEAEYGKYGLGPADEYEMDRREHQLGSFGQNNVLMSGLASFAVKTQQSKVRFSLLHIQSGESKAGVFDFESRDQGSDFDAFQHGLDYSQRSLSHILLEGNHNKAEKKLAINWKLASTYSVMSDPDVRFTRYEITDANSVRIGTEVGFPERIWRKLNEINSSGALILSKGFEINGNASKLYAGAVFTHKYRTYIIRNFSINPRGDYPLTGDPDELFLEENLWIKDGDIGMGTTYETPFIPNNPNEYEATALNSSGYISADLALSPKLKTLVGVRLESFIQYYTGSDQQKTNVLVNEKVLNTLQLFPSLNLVYQLAELQNLRVSYTMTVARPSFKELSYAEIYDPISGSTFIGGFHKDGDDSNGTEIWDGNLVSTNIQNFDFRWERFGKDGQLLSFSAFYKLFKNPIEIVQYTKQVGAFQPRNVGDGQSYGIELELRQGFAFLSESLSAWNISANVTLNKSSIEMNDTEYESRVDNARTGQTIDRYRAMSGQAPYLLNGGISYRGGKGGFWERLNAGIYYNVQGTTLEYVGAADRPDIYREPFHSLNFNSSIALGANHRLVLGIKVENMLNEEVKLVYKSYEARDQFFERRGPGILSTIKVSYNF